MRFSRLETREIADQVYNLFLDLQKKIAEELRLAWPLPPVLTEVTDSVKHEIEELELTLNTFLCELSSYNPGEDNLSDLAAQFSELHCTWANCINKITPNLLPRDSVYQKRQGLIADSSKNLEIICAPFLYKTLLPKIEKTNEVSVTFAQYLVALQYFLSPETYRQLLSNSAHKKIEQALQYLQKFTANFCEKDTAEKLACIEIIEYFKMTCETVIQGGFPELGSSENQLIVNMLKVFLDEITGCYCQFSALSAMDPEEETGELVTGTPEASETFSDAISSVGNELHSGNASPAASVGFWSPTKTFKSPLPSTKHVSPIYVALHEKETAMPLATTP